MALGLGLAEHRRVLFVICYGGGCGIGAWGLCFKVVTFVERAMVPMQIRGRLRLLEELGIS